jgi:hypothetical protein
LGEVTGHVASGSNPVQYCTAKANHEVLMMNTGFCVGCVLTGYHCSTTVPSHLSVASKYCYTLSDAFRTLRPSSGCLCERAHCSVLSILSLLLLLLLHCDTGASSTPYSPVAALVPSSTSSASKHKTGCGGQFQSSVGCSKSLLQQSAPGTSTQHRS